MVGPVWEEEIEVFGECVGEGAHLKCVHCAVRGKAVEAENSKLTHVVSFNKA